ncbi:hypothetical protein M0813_19426 [Anaeramoeba flamelloides]|uniref:Reverse transcriptase n=1 Tax=Anaeramoeba flamelloides TaxID=1746091 RepID=A0ABQ8YNW5_9EUKA|nr:hypothetical protein M0813_19426 [Anaeramoeba flamelloides]
MNVIGKENVKTLKYEISSEKYTDDIEKDKRFGICPACQKPSKDLKNHIFLGCPVLKKKINEDFVTRKRCLKLWPLWKEFHEYVDGSQIFKANFQYRNLGTARSILEKLKNKLVNERVDGIKTPRKRKVFLIGDLENEKKVENVTKKAKNQIERANQKLKILDVLKKTIIEKKIEEDFNIENGIDFFINNFFMKFKIGKKMRQNLLIQKSVKLLATIIIIKEKKKGVNYDTFLEKITFWNFDDYKCQIKITLEDINKFSEFQD